MSWCLRAGNRLNRGFSRIIRIALIFEDQYLSSESGFLGL